MPEYTSLGWLQKHPHSKGSTQLITLGNEDLFFIDDWRTVYPAIWWKISTRRMELDSVEVLVQGWPTYGWTDTMAGGQVFWGVDTSSFRVPSPPYFTVDIAVDPDMEPDPGGGAMGWGESLEPPRMRMLIDWVYVNPTVAVITCFGGEWWDEMLKAFAEYLQTELEGISWTETTDASFSAPDDVVTMVDDNLDIEAIKTLLKNGLVVIHSLSEPEPDPDFSGSPAVREGREFTADITIFAKNLKGIDSDAEQVLYHVACMAEDLKQELAPSGGPPNRLNSDSYLYFSRLEMITGPKRADDVAEDGSAARVDYRFHGFKFQLAS